MLTLTAIKDDWHGDTSRMFVVGECSVKAKKLIKITYDCNDESNQNN